MTDFAAQLQEALGTNYQLERELTGGGMSRVFVAVERLLGRKVVVKVLPPDLAAGVNRERFRREIQVAAQLQHPHIVPLLSAGEQGDLLWYTMPYIDGESLRAALERQKQFGVREVMRIMHDVVDALAFAHERGVIHRDIKPANILTQGAHALVTDFGVAKAISAAMPHSGVTSTGIAIGTPAYMAPEQLAGDPSADHRMDIYAVGLLAYELCTGASPFSGPSPRETLAAQLTRDPTPLYESLPGVPRTLSDLIMRCLAKDPDKRPQRAADVLFELDSMTMPLGVTPQGGVSTSKKRRTWPMVAAGLVVVGALAAGRYAMVRSQQAAPTVTPPPAVALPAARLDTGAKRGAGVGAIGPAGGSGSNAAATSAVVRPPRPLITHEDSLRIAEAVRKRIEANKTRDSLTKARMAEETARKMTDSIIAANSVAGTPIGQKRVAIIEPLDQTQWPEATILGRAVADSLRRAMRPRARDYFVINQDSVRSTLARTRDVSEIRKSLTADIIIQVQLRALPRDSAVLLVQSSDYSSPTPFRGRTASSQPAPRSQVLSSLDQVLLSTLTALDEMMRAPRRNPAGFPGMPTMPPRVPPTTPP